MKYNINKTMTPEEIKGAKKILSARADNKPCEKWEHFVLGYFVSNYGRVYNFFSHDIELTENQKTYTKDGKLKKNHYVFFACENGKDSKVWVHKAVYFLFGCIPDSIPYREKILESHSSYKVHHIDADPHNNYIGNLYLMLDKWHTKLTIDLYNGKIKQPDVDTVEKLNAYIRNLDSSIQWVIA